MEIVKRLIARGALASLVFVSASSAIAGEHGKKLHIPPGHLPPAGQCRIWYPGTPPGHQPPPGDCRILSHQLPRGAWLVSRDRVWVYEDRPDYYYYRRPYASHPAPMPYRRDVYDGRSYSDKREIRRDARDARQARKEVQDNREDVNKNYAEIKKDKAELRRDLRSGASRKEIRQDRQEIRDDAQKIAASKNNLRQSEKKLDAARQELRDDLRRR